MGSPNTSPLVAITAGDGAKFKALRNTSASDITANVTVVSKQYGTQTYDLIVTANSLVQNDCIVNTTTATLYGYLAEGY